ncbi:MAG TPA: DUF3043 domain-containing protein [Mycobacteriales bacterium]|nr:DUF3043 domain-containing protein [Mycobacteriales bacterium]
MSEQSTGKGRPTPKRSEAQKRRTGPVAPPPTSRREAAKQLRAKQADNRQRVRKGSLVGDETALLKRDQGPVRRMVREMIDGRRSLGWILLPLAILVIVSGLVKSPALQELTFAIWLASLAAVAIDMTFTGFAIRSAIKQAFPEEPRWRGHIRYGLMRTTVMRRFRVPRPTVRP